MYSQNLISNGSFENISPPLNWNNWFGEFVTASQNPMHRVLLDWDEFNSADLLTASCTHTYDGSPMNLFGYCYPKNGINYTGIITFIGNGNKTKEYIFQHLNQPLQAGKTYCLNFYVSRADISKGAIKNIGAYFSNNVLSTGSLGYINATPQVLNQNGFITDTVNWIGIQGCFIANGGEQYITIGNFNSNVNTDTLYTGSNYSTSNAPYYSYYYIDDITLIDQATVGIKDVSYELGTMSVYPNPANDILNINLSSLKENTEIKIYNQLGELVLNEHLTTQNSSLKTHHLQSGVYFYSILVGEKIIKTDKIVIIK